ncbi:hypothetical protein BDP27DRAFT_350681 [Rhodocollybia butyracea]|uniref:Uncharacterized protein n=1 Tax=Rhodocollybia butyracea TaxID=206335 RepID=A0A9P5QA64_9AGAR|nr:hypothetical protein BDP27DRAFT_350681 [Rhodocollybia butyracea]
MVPSTKCTQCTMCTEYFELSDNTCFCTHSFAAHSSPPPRTLPMRYCPSPATTYYVTLDTNPNPTVSLCVNCSLVYLTHTTTRPMVPAPIHHSSQTVMPWVPPDELNMPLPINSPSQRRRIAGRERQDHQQAREIRRPTPGVPPSPLGSLTNPSSSSYASTRGNIQITTQLAASSSGSQRASSLGPSSSVSFFAPVAYSSKPRSTGRSSKAVGYKSYNFIFILHTEPPATMIIPDRQVPFPLRAPPSHVQKAMVHQASALGLCFSLQGTKKKSDRVAPTLNMRLQQHLESSGLSLLDMRGKPHNGAITGLWTFLECKQVSRSNSQLPPVLYHFLSPQEVTFGKLEDWASKYSSSALVEDPDAPTPHLVFIAPVMHIIGGPLNGSISMHCCLGAHLWRSAEQNDFDNEETEVLSVSCNILCPVVESDARPHRFPLDLSPELPAQPSLGHEPPSLNLDEDSDSDYIPVRSRSRSRSQLQSRLRRYRSRSSSGSPLPPVEEILPLRLTTRATTQRSSTSTSFPLLDNRSQSRAPSPPCRSYQDYEQWTVRAARSFVETPVHDAVHIALQSFIPLDGAGDLRLEGSDIKALAAAFWSLIGAMANGAPTPTLPDDVFISNFDAEHLVVPSAHRQIRIGMSSSADFDNRPTGRGVWRALFQEN